MPCPSLLKVLGAFALILACYRLKLPLAQAILAGAVALGLLLGLGPGALAGAALEGAAGPDTVALVVLTMVLLWLSALMEQGGQLKRIVHHAGRLLRRPVLSMAAMPALVGLLPMPGGALFSAPMVRHAAGQARVGGDTLSAINYWFRHVWEYWWPLYPGVIVTLSLTGADPVSLIRIQLPLSLFMMTGGLLFLFRGVHPDLRQSGEAAPAGTWRSLLVETSSIWVIVLAFVPATLAIKHLPGGLLPQGVADTARRFLPIALGLVLSLLWTIRLNRTAWRGVWAPLADRKLYSMSLLVLAIMVFQNVLRAAGAAVTISHELAEAQVPVVVVIALLPFVSGMVTGVAIGFVGTAFPIVIGLVQVMPDRPTLLPFIVLAYGFGHMGQMLSPLHLCQVLSNEYFGTGYAPVYRRIVGPAVVAATCTTAYFVLLRMWTP